MSVPTKTDGNEDIDVLYKPGRHCVERVATSSFSSRVPPVASGTLENPSIIQCVASYHIFVNMPCFWYKPDLLHRNLYPSAKDENGNPTEATVNGEKIIQLASMELKALGLGTCM
eukprot:6200333-Pleurochrysis_carterae.AAC.3